MTTRIFKSAAAILLVCVLILSMTGCEKLDYRKAIDLYNAGRFDEAAELFSTLNGYEDSAQMQTLSRYWEAITLAEAGKHTEALPRFQKLGNYEDSAQRAIECTYQIAIADFEAGNYQDAENFFLKVPDYRQTPEYLRQLNWQKFFDAVLRAGEEGIGTGTSEGMHLQVTAKKGEPDQLTFFLSRTKNLGYAFYDDLALTLTRDSLEAEFTAKSTFTMNKETDQMGSEQIASGKVDISACTAGTALKADTFQMTGTDNLGNTINTDDPSDMLMGEDMAQNLHDLLTLLPPLLNSFGVPVTLQDIGFAAN